MAKLSHLHIVQILSYVDYSDLKHFIQINHRCKLMCNKLIQTQCLDKNLTNVLIPINTLYLTPSIINGDSANDEFTYFDYRKLTNLRNNKSLKALCFSQSATTDYHLFSSVIRQLTPHSLTRLDLGTYDIGEESIIKYATLIGTTQTSLLSLNFWKDPGKDRRFSQPHEVEMFSRLSNCENLRCFCWSPKFSALQNLTFLNVFYHSDSFNDSVGGMKKLPNLRVLILRSTTLNRFISISRVTELTQLTHLNIAGTQIVKDPKVFSLDSCTNLKYVCVYYIESISEDLFDILKYSTKFYVQLQLYTMPLENQQFPPFSTQGSSFDSKRIQILHMTMVQRKIKQKFARAMQNRFKQWPPNLYFKGYEIFDVKNVNKCTNLADSLVRLEFHFIEELINLGSVNSFSLLTTLSLRHCRIKTNSPIGFTGLQSLKHLYISDCDNVHLLCISDISSLTSFTLKDQSCVTPLLPQIFLLTNLKQISLSNIRTITDNDVQFLIYLDNIQHYIFDENSIFQQKEKYFSTPTRTVAFASPQD